jgi:glutathione S-transferase
MPPLLLKLVFDRVESSPAPFFVRPIARAIAKVKDSFVLPQIRQHLASWRASWQARLVCRREFSAADIQMSFPLEAAPRAAGWTRSIRS